MLKNIKLFFSLERFAFLILGLETLAFLLELVLWNKFHYWSLIYTIPYICFGIYWFYRMIKLFVEWPRRKRYHLATVNYFNFCKERGLPIKKSKLYGMNSPCAKITRNEICKNLNIIL